MCVCVWLESVHLLHVLLCHAPVMPDQPVFRFFHILLLLLLLVVVVVVVVVVILSCTCVCVLHYLDVATDRQRRQEHHGPHGLEPPGLGHAFQHISPVPSNNSTPRRIQIHAHGKGPHAHDKADIQAVAKYGTSFTDERDREADMLRNIIESTQQYVSFQIDAHCTPFPIPQSSESPQMQWSSTNLLSSPSPCMHTCHSILLVLVFPLSLYFINLASAVT
jgi:hypothetical protein